MSAALDPTALAAIVARPLDDVPRLALADALRASGDPRGAFITAQVRLAQRGLGRADRAALVRESDRLSAEHGTTWSAAAAGLRSHRLRRGFIDDVIGSAQELAAHGADLFAREPITTLTVTEASADMLAPLARDGAFLRVARLTIRGVLGDDGARVLAEALAKRTLPLVALNVGATGIEAEGAAALAPALKGCGALALTGNGIGDEGLAALAKCKALSSLTTLFLTANELTDEGVIAFARSSSLSSLERLGMAGNDDVTTRSLGALAKSKKLKRLRWVEYTDEDGNQRVAVRKIR